MKRQRNHTDLKQSHTKQKKIKKIKKIKKKKKKEE
jgi:hypothetical protein